MRRDTVNYLVVGTFVLVLFAAFLVFLYQITGRSGPTDRYIVNYGNIEGVKKGTPVLYEGFQIGQVEDMQPVTDGAVTRFHLTLSVAKGWRIPADSVAHVVKSGLLAAVAIDIRAGESPQAVAPGGEIRGREAADIFATVGEVAADLRILTRETLKPLLENVDRHVELVSTDIRAVANESLRPILDDQVRVLLDRLNASAQRLETVLNDENLENVESTLTNLHSASKELTTLLGRIEESRVNLDRLLTDADGVISANEEDIRALIRDLARSAGTVSRHIDAVTWHLEGSSRNMHEFTRQIRENPGLLLRSSPQPDPVPAR
jgi:phospholipid/cholesterol/gamma-HCH transport system substrate-binding protein